jgi:hypothetical protein
VISADEKTSVQARCRCHPTLPPGAARVMRVEHEYKRRGALQYLAAWDVHRARVFGRCEEHTGIVPFDRLWTRSWPASRTPRRGGCSGSWTTGPPTEARHPSIGLRAATPGEGASGCGSSTLRSHSSWLNQIEIYFSIVQRKVLTPNDFTDLDEVEQRLLAFERRYELVATPFEWKFTREDLATLMTRLAEKEQSSLSAAAWGPWIRHRTFDPEH